MMATEMTEQEFNDLLPDYLTSNLDAKMHQKVNDHLRHSAAAREQLAELQAVLKQAQSWHDRQPEPPGLQAFLDYAQAHPLSTSTQKESWLKRHLRIDSAGFWQSATAVLICVLGVQVFLQDNNMVHNLGGVRSIHGVPSDQRTLTVAFKSDRTEQQIRDALLSADARIIDGPDGLLGIYKLAVPAATVDESVAALKASGVFENLQVEPSKHDRSPALPD